MSDERSIDSLIAAHTVTPDPAAAPAADTAKPVADQQTENVNPNANTDEDNNLNEDGSQKTEAQKAEERWPKKAENAVKYRDRTIGRQRAIIEAANREIERLKAIAEPKAAQPAQNASSEKPADYPNADDPKYKNLGEFLADVARYEARQELEAGKKAQQTDAEKQRQQQYVAQREAVVAEQAKKFIEATPDAMEVLQENVDLLDELPDHVYNLILETDNASQVFYTLAKEGKLESLATMTPLQVMREIAKAELSGTSTAQSNAGNQANADPVKPKTNIVTNAPNPPSSAAKGTASSTEKTPERMSREELRNWYSN